MAISKRLRFEILRRDNHACRYCGRSAPEVKLTIDHVVPETLGGSDDPGNLVAACQDCNGGKSSVPADAPLVQDVASDAMRWARAMRQAADELTAQDDALEDILDAVYEAWRPFWIPSDWRSSVVTFIHAGLDREALLHMVSIAYAKRGLESARWNYFCGCCWKRIRELQERAQKILRSDEEPDATTVPAITRWTIADVEEYQLDAVKYARDQIGDERLDKLLQDPSRLPECRHGVPQHCGDPLCSIEDAAMLMMTKNKIGERVRGDEAICDEAEALLDG